MPIRISGLTSGLDTEAIVGALVSAYSYKKDKYVKAQTKVSWKQDAWKSLNSKVYSLYTSVGNMRYSSNYSVKKTTVSDSTKASATASGTAINGTQTLEISKLARTAYVTGGELDSSITGKSTLSDLGIKTGSATGKGSIQVRTNTGTKTIEVDGTTTINEFVNKLNEAGVQANFDEKNHRFFISSKTSGLAGDFSVSANNEIGLTSLIKMGLLSNSEIQSITSSATDSDTNTVKTLDIIKKSITLGRDMVEDKDGFKKKLLDIKENLAASKEAVENGTATSEDNDRIAIANAIDSAYGATYGTDGKIDWDNISDEDLASLADKIFADASYDDSAATATSQEITASINAIRDAYLKIAKIESSKYDSEEEKEQDLAAARSKLTEVLSDPTNAKWQKYIEQNFGTVNSESDSSYSNFWIQSDNQELAKSVYYRVDLSAQITVNNKEFKADKEAFKVDGQDATIKLNGVEYTSNTNSITVNGLTIEALATTTEGSPITVTVNNDTDGIYDKVKDFLSQYNTLMNEMQKLYNADSAKDYEPLTEDEKAEMSESEIEKWEQKIKDSLLRRDNNLSSVISAMTMSMMKTYEINGKQYAWSTFGIHTLGNLNAEKNEGYAYHIDGDSEDTYTSGKEDKLRAALAEDPDAVIDFLKQMTSGLYSSLDEKMKSTSVKSVYTVYNDKEMASEYSNYSKLIKTWTDRVTDMEDAYYKKFSQMESALAKLQSNSSSLTSMLGG